MRRLMFLILIGLIGLGSGEASAFLGSSAADTASGLDVAAGFDVNTITTLTGTVLTPPARHDNEPQAVMTVATPQNQVTVILGPWWYWEKQTMTITVEQKLTLSGSLAQGQDGGLYLFAQRVEDPDNGESVTLRSEAGKPLWSHGPLGNQSGNRQFEGRGLRSGAGSRGAGMRGGRR